MLKTFKVEYYITKPKLLKTEVVAFDYKDCKKQFLKKSGLNSENILKIKNP